MEPERGTCPWLDSGWPSRVVRHVPGAASLRLPASGNLGPKVLVTNELAGSGGGYFPWVFRQMNVGPLIETRTWGGLGNTAVPYPLVDGGTFTAPALAGFGPTCRDVVQPFAAGRPRESGR